jgi:hypothetical protein
MKEFVPHHAENHGLAPGPGRASKFLTFICFIESEGGQGKSSATALFKLCEPREGGSFY